MGEGCLVSHSLQFRSGGPPGSKHIPLPVRGGFNKAVIAVPVTRQANIAFLGLSLERKILPVIYCEARLLKLLLQKSRETKFYPKKLFSRPGIHMCETLITHVITVLNVEQNEEDIFFRSLAF